MYRGLGCAVGPASPPPTPTPAHGTHCPPFWSLSRPSAFGASAFGASAFGAGAFGASAFGAISVPPDFRVLCRVYIPLSISPILLSLFSALPAISTS